MPVYTFNLRGTLIFAGSTGPKILSGLDLQVVANVFTTVNWGGQISQAVNAMQDKVLAFTDAGSDVLAYDAYWVNRAPGVPFSIFRWSRSRTGDPFAKRVPAIACVKLKCTYTLAVPVKYSTKYFSKLGVSWLTEDPFKPMGGTGLQAKADSLAWTTTNTAGAQTWRAGVVGRQGVAFQGFNAVTIDTQWATQRRRRGRTSSGNSNYYPYNAAGEIPFPPTQDWP